MNKSFLARLEVFEGRLYDQHVKVPKDIFEYYKSQKVNRFMAQFNEGEFFPCAILSAGSDGMYLIVSNDLKNRNRLSIGSEIEVLLSPDKSKYGMPMAEELEVLLQQEPEFDLHFHKLTAGKQRSLIHLVSKLKSPNKRVEKAMIICNHLITRLGNLDYKILNEDFKMGLNYF